MYFDPVHSPTSAPSSGRPKRNAERVSFDMLVRYVWRGLRATVMLKDLTRFGARIEGLEALRKGEGLTLLLPGQPAAGVTVAWAEGRSAGLQFDMPIGQAALDTLIRDFATMRPDLAPMAIAPRRAAA